MESDAENHRKAAERIEIVPTGRSGGGPGLRADLHLRGHSHNADPRPGCNPSPGHKDSNRIASRSAEALALARTTRPSDGRSCEHCGRRTPSKPRPPEGGCGASWSTAAPSHCSRGFRMPPRPSASDAGAPPSRYNPGPMCSSARVHEFRSLRLPAHGDLRAVHVGPRRRRGLEPSPQGCTHRSAEGRAAQGKRGLPDPQHPDPRTRQRIAG